MNDAPFQNLAPGEIELVGSWISPYATQGCFVTERIGWLRGQLEMLFLDKYGDYETRGLYLDPRDGRLWAFSENHEGNPHGIPRWDESYQCRLSVIDPEDAVQRFPVRHPRFHGWIVGTVKAGKLRSFNALARTNAAAMLAAPGGADHAFALTALVGLTEDEDAGVRVQALDSLYSRDPEPSPSEMARRMGILLASRRGASELAGRVLRRSGPAGQRVAAAVAPRLAKEERLWLLSFLIGQQNPSTPEETAAFLQKWITDAAPEVQLQAIHLAAQFRLSSTALIDLLDRLKSLAPPVRRAALFAVGDSHPTDQAVIDRLEALLGDSDPETRANAAVAFAKMGAATEAAVKRLGGLLADADGSVRLQAAYALSRMGCAAVPARVQLERAVNDSSRRVREWAAVALRGLEADSAL